MLTLQVNAPDMAAAIRALAVSEQEKMVMVLESVGIDTIAWLRSLTEEMRPPVRSTEGERQAHPGHWADRTGQLALAYDHKVERRGTTGAVLILSNSSEYAGALEAHDGYFVLKGVLDFGGPAAIALRMAAAKIAPSWRVVTE